MKKSTLALMSILCIDGLAAQTTNTFPSSGPVGIGTITPATNYMFHIRNPRAYARVEATEDHAILELIAADSTGSGKAGIYLYRGLGNIFGALVVERGASPGFSGSQGNDVVLGSVTSVPLKLAANNDVKMTVLPSGYVGIGVTVPNEKLSVNGNILANGNITAKKITVTQSGWSDYVFDDEYKLNSLKNVEKFIKENKHLPGVPSAKQVEDKGINIGESQALLLKKIEELTLYIIQADKERSLMKKDISDMKKIIKK